MATLMDGKALAERIRADVKAEVARREHVGLATVLVGDDPASEIYIRLKHKALQEVGMEGRDVRLPADTAQEDVLRMVEELNGDDAIDGMLVQLPLPRHLDEAAIIRAIDPAKDVDGLHPINGGLLYLGRPGHVPATPLGIMRLLAEYDVELEGARAVVVGRSAIVGKPVALLLLAGNATVTVCHSRTPDLEARTREADVLVVAVGRDRLIGPGGVKAGAAVVDVGMNRSDEGLFGDVDPSAADVAGLLTPVPGGVGPMTIALLLENTVRASRFRSGEVAFPF
jgi:methylenetetrahydrofolate dehydrogenase (NADP+)/methenyltetrahydrofolate cyclohydrolase